jgi:hypothetical protein
VGTACRSDNNKRKGASGARWLASRQAQGVGNRDGAGVWAAALIRAMVRWQNNNANESGTYRSRVAWNSTGSLRCC